MDTEKRVEWARVLRDHFQAEEGGLRVSLVLKHILTANHGEKSCPGWGVVGLE